MLFICLVANDKDKVTFSLEENEPDDGHKPHQLFCEMDELQSNLEWKEAARWLKFEEDVENGGRWSKPHVATLSLHSLLELRSCLLNGVMLLDFPGEDLQTIVDGLIASLVSAGLLSDTKCDDVRNALMSKHIHQFEKEFQKQLDSGEKKTFPLIKSLADMGKKSSQAEFASSNTPPLSKNISGNNFLTPNDSSGILKPTSTHSLDVSGTQTSLKAAESRVKVSVYFLIQKVISILAVDIQYYSLRIRSC